MSIHCNSSLHISPEMRLVRQNITFQSCYTIIFITTSLCRSFLTKMINVAQIWHGTPCTFKMILINNSFSSTQPYFHFAFFVFIKKVENLMERKMFIFCWSTCIEFNAQVVMHRGIRLDVSIFVHINVEEVVTSSMDHVYMGVLILTLPPLTALVRIYQYK